MSSPAVQPVRPGCRPACPRLAEAAVDRARLTVVPRVRARAPRVPFVTLVSLVLLGGVVGLLMFNTSMQQASFAATALEDQAATLTAREQTLRMELEGCATRSGWPSRPRRWAWCFPAPGFLALGPASRRLPPRRPRRSGSGCCPRPR